MPRIVKDKLLGSLEKVLGNAKMNLGIRFIWYLVPEPLQPMTYFKDSLEALEYFSDIGDHVETVMKDLQKFRDSVTEEQHEELTEKYPALEGLFDSLADLEYLVEDKKDEESSA